MRRLLIVLTAALILAGSVLTAQASNPSIVWTSPANGATNVDPKALTYIWAQFNQNNMDSASFTGSNASRISIKAGNTNYSSSNYSVSMVQSSSVIAPNSSVSGDYVLITLSAQLSYSTTYTITINKRVQDLSYPPDQMATSYSWSFTTKAQPASDTTPPTVTATSPVAGATGVPLTAQVGITFSEPVNSSTINTSNISVGGVTGTVALDSSGKIATFTPSSSLAANTTYTVTVSGVKDLAGNTLASPYTFTFTTLKTDTTAPTVTSVSPLAGATSVDPSSAITATFSEGLTASTISTSSFTVSGGVTGTVSYDPTTFTATFVPSSALANATNYTVTISTAVKDLAGNAMASNKTWSFTTMAAANVPPLNDYCQVPPYVTNAGTSVKPNVLLLLDNSGSMYEFAYKNPGDGNSTWDASYNPNGVYYGYFDYTKMYQYTTTSGGYFQIDSTKTQDNTSFWSGNFLNWLTMRRVDVIRKVLVGGKTQPRSANTANFLIPTEDPDRDFYKTYSNNYYVISGGSSSEQIYDSTHNATYTLQVYVGNQPPQDGLVLRYSDRINFGIEIFNDGYRFENSTNSVRDGGNIAAYIGNTGTDLITKIESTDPTTWTPLAESLYEATRYFQATTSAYNGGTYSGHDPIQYKCQKNFVLILTDGESTKDENVPGTAFSGSSSAKVSDPNFNIKTWMDSIATQEGTSSQWATAANTDQGTYYLEGVAYWSHVTDLRSDFSGTQNLTIYTVFAFDDSAIGREILQKTSKYGGFDDFNSTGKPDSPSKWDKDGNGIPDTYYEASSGTQLESSLEAAFNSILARVASGTAASILSNSEGTGANILQAVFFPRKYYENSTFVDWTGEMHSLWYYIDPFINNSTVREDTDYVAGTPDPPHYLNLSKDRVVDFYFDQNQQQVLVKRYYDLKGDGQPDVDTNGDGVLDQYTFSDQVSSDQVLSIWRSGQLLWGRTTPRTLYTQTSGTLTDISALDTSTTTVQGLLQAANQTEANKIISYISGTDQSGYRNRTVTIGGVSGVWKLGDIVSSTPRLQSSQRLNAYNLPNPTGYNDLSYGDDNNKRGFIYSSAYANRGMVYVGSNDGMLHAFKLGTLDVTASGDKKATLTGTGLGQEMWTYIPKNALPYLRYLADPNYNHLYFVDGTTVINDVSIGKPTSCTASNYWDCPLDTTTGTGNNWRTVLISSMGLGGASKMSGAGCKGTTCVETPTVDPSNTSNGLGYSSYFALDVTDPNNPTFLWEFGGPNLGFSTTGAAFVKIAARKADGITPDSTKNGKWFAVVASGPTGPIDTTAHQFKGTSNQNLTVYVLNLADGSVAAKIDTLTDGTKLGSAFAGSITTAVIDTDRWNKYAPGNYQDDALYIGYTQLSGTTWTGGGVLRLMTGENPDPTTWKLSKVIDGVGPVVTNIARLQDRKNHNLWLYFGTGRYFYNLDDSTNGRLIAGLKEPCYTSSDTLNPTCTTKYQLSDLTQQDSGINSVTNGWYIDLDAQDTTNNFGAERLVTDPVALTNGAVFFTTFKPTADVCSYGGTSYMWATRYDTGGSAAAAMLQGKALVQVSTGSFEQIDLSTAFTDKLNRRMSTPMTGKPPSDPPPIVSKSNLKPLKKILHIQEH